MKATRRYVAGSIAECRQWIGYNSWNTYFRRSRGPALSFPFLNVCDIVFSLCLPNSGDQVSDVQLVSQLLYRVFFFFHPSGNWDGLQGDTLRFGRAFAKNLGCSFILCMFSLCCPAVLFGTGLVLVMPLPN